MHPNETISTTFTCTSTLVMANPNTIIQWNCRGLKPNFDAISLLLNKHNPIAFCLQETFLKDSDKISFKNFNICNHICTTGEKATGGVSILINRKIPHSNISLNTTLQATAVKVTMHRELTIMFFILTSEYTNKLEQS